LIIYYEFLMWFRVSCTTYTVSEILLLDNQKLYIYRTSVPVYLYELPAENGPVILSEFRHNMIKKELRMQSGTTILTPIYSNV